MLKKLFRGDFSEQHWSALLSNFSLQNVMFSWADLDVPSHLCKCHDDVPKHDFLQLPVGRPRQTIRHTYLHALKFMGVIPEEDQASLISDWLPAARDDPKDWEFQRKALTPCLIGQREDLKAD